MSGETEAQPSGWTPDLLNRHLSSQIAGDRQTSRERFAFFGFIVGLLWLVNDRALKIQQVENDKALALEKSDNARHFETLNHENERTSAWRSETPSLDRYEGFEKTVEARFRALEASQEAETVRGATAKTLQDEARGAAREAQGDVFSGQTARRANRQLAIGAIGLLLAFSGAFTGYLASNKNAPSPITTTVTTTTTTTTLPAP